MKKNLERIKELTEELTVIPYFNEEIMSMFLENSPIVSWIKDADGKYIFANNSFLLRFNIKENIIGKSDKDYFPEDVVEKLRENDLMILEKNEKLELYENVPTPNGKMHKWFVIKFPLILQNKSYVGGFAVDITSGVEVNV
uniref:PAS fold-4 domain-containing protein n=1 Tax=viral metagenome TaxID=1070528 RepID=A0A6M3XQM7_9ZZZZ